MLIKLILINKLNFNDIIYSDVFTYILNNNFYLPSLLDVKIFLIFSMKHLPSNLLNI
jgi:hypothetical protein